MSLGSVCMVGAMMPMPRVRLERMSSVNMRFMVGYCSVVISRSSGSRKSFTLPSRLTTFIWICFQPLCLLRF